MVDRIHAMGKRAMMVIGVLWAVGFAVAPLFSAPVPNTAVTQCHNDIGRLITCPSLDQKFYGQDGNYTFNSDAYTSLDFSGNAPVVSPAFWSVFWDDVTGLICKLKRGKGRLQHSNNPHNADNTYIRHDTEQSNKGGNPATLGDDTYTKDFIEASSIHQRRWPIDRVQHPLYRFGQEYQYAANVASSRHCSPITDANGTPGTGAIRFDDGYNGRNGKPHDYYVQSTPCGQSQALDYFVEPLGSCRGLIPCYSTVQAALDAAGDGAVIKVGQGTYNESPVKSNPGTVTISGGWNETFTSQTPGTTRINNPRVNDGTLKLQELLVFPAYGFLTWPFPNGTRYTRNDYLGRDSVFDRNRTVGIVEPYDFSIPVGCSGSVCVVDNHPGIDIGVEIGTTFVTAAPLRIKGFYLVPGREGKQVGVILVDYQNGHTGRYAHAQLMTGVGVGDYVQRGQPIGYVEPSDVGASHLHFEIQKSGTPVDPYDSISQPTGISLWTVYNNPQYAR